MKSVLIADDEPHARDYLVRLLKQRVDLTIVGVLKNGQEVIDFCRTFSPDLILLDIEMPGKTGLEAAKSIAKQHPKSMILFTTAYNQYAIEAFDYAAMGYLLKPFDQEELNKNLDRAISTWEVKQKADLNESVQKLWGKMQKEDRTYLTHFLIKSKGLEIEVAIEEVQALTSDSEYTQIHTDKKTYLKRQSLQHLEKQLPKQFYRIHRSTMLNADHILSWKYLSNGTFQFEMESGKFLISSRSYKDRIREWVSSYK